MVFSQRPGSLLWKLSRGPDDEKKLTNDVQAEPSRLSGGQLSASREPFQNNPDTEYSKGSGAGAKNQDQRDSPSTSP